MNKLHLTGLISLTFAIIAIGPAFSHDLTDLQSSFFPPSNQIGGYEEMFHNQVIDENGQGKLELEQAFVACILLEHNPCIC